VDDLGLYTFQVPTILYIKEFKQDLALNKVMYVTYYTKVSDLKLLQPVFSRTILTVFKKLRLIFRKNVKNFELSSKITEL
jgi:hypothetical protein